MSRAIPLRGARPEPITLDVASGPTLATAPEARIQHLAATAVCAAFAAATPVLVPIASQPLAPMRESVPTYQAAPITVGALTVIVSRYVHLLPKSAEGDDDRFLHDVWHRAGRLGAPSQPCTGRHACARSCSAALTSPPIRRGARSSTIASSATTWMQPRRGPARAADLG